MNVFTFKGLQNYGPVQKKLFDLLCATFMYTNYEFQQAIEEAVCNAARYSVDGPEKANITIKVRRMPYNVAVTVISKTHPFDAKAYQKKLEALKKDPKISKMEWGDYIGLSTASSGFWYMLTGCDYLVMDEHGQAITLVASIDKERPEEDIKKTKIIDILVPRFMVKDDGVIA